ncbi:hypothetical protein GCM10022215_38030 [Nocardioides fonticola]|uniref:Uncharacterized protein n=1 Tax=Nocardioides fonticola TaxID=450363 RepID=A0ABP7XXI1_9ACTN
MTTTPASAPATRRGDPHDHGGDRQAFELYGRRITHTNSADVQQLLAAAHSDRIRPLCLCRPDGVAMYVAKIGPEKYVIKRMPDSGLAHTHRCTSRQRNRRTLALWITAGIHRAREGCRPATAPGWSRRDAAGRPQ